MQRLVRALDWDLREGRCASTVSENTVEVMTFGGSMTMRIEFKTLTYNADAEACEDGRASMCRREAFERFFRGQVPQRF